MDAIVFDLDDTLIDWQGAEAAAIRAVARTIRDHEPGHVVTCYDAVKQENFAAFRRDGKWWFLRDRLTRLRAHLSAEPHHVDAWETTFISAVRENLDYYDGALDVVALAREEHKVALLTNGPANVQRPKVDRLGIAAHVDAVCIAGEMNLWKPDPAAFNAALGAVGATPEHAMMVGDSLEFDILPAKALGMRTAWIQPPFSSPTFDAVLAPAAQQRAAARGPEAAAAAAAVASPATSKTAGVSHPDADHVVPHIAELAHHIRALRS